LGVLPKAKLGHAEHPVDDVVGASYAIINEVRPAVSAGDKQWRRFTLRES
jgi:hypothetical protein